MKRIICIVLLAATSALSLVSCTEEAVTPHTVDGGGGGSGCGGCGAQGSGGSI